MTEIIPREQLQGNLFQGGEHGGIPISFFLAHSSPGGGPSLHKHPYEEIFVVQKGQATFTIGDTTHFLRGGQIVIAPANTPHKFKNTGEEPLQMITIHPGQRPSQSGLRIERLT